MSILACGGGHSTVPAGNSLAGNWQITLNGTSTASVFTGFLTQTGTSVSGGLVVALSANCSGVGTVAGTVNAQNVSLTINQSGSTISLTGDIASGAPMNGTFTTQGGECTSLPSQGTWSAITIAPISGAFHGSFTSISGNGIVTVKGTLNEGPNTGNSTASVSGTLATTSGTPFCSYLFPGAITGVISGTAVQLNLFGANGLPYAQLGTIEEGGATVSPDATALSGRYILPGTTGSSCQGDQGTFSLSFP